MQSSADASGVIDQWLTDPAKQVDHTLPEGLQYIDVDQIQVLDAVRTRLNSDRSLKPGEQFDLGRRLDAVLLLLAGK
jgi:hypothetical protein